MMEITILGPTRVTDQDQHYGAADLGGTKPRQLLELLAIQPGHPVSKDLLAELLWEGHPPASYIATLESYMCVLRRRLGLARGRRTPLATSTSGYVLDADLTRVDLVEARTLLAGDPAQVQRGADLVAAGLLASDPYAAWAVREREQLAETLCGACTQAANVARGAGNPGLAVTLARAAVRAVPLSEPAHRELMESLRQAGARTEALQTYASLRARTVEDLGVEPGPETRRLYLGLLAEDTDRDDRREPAYAVTLVRLLRDALVADSRLLEGNPWGAEVGRLLLTRAGSSARVSGGQVGVTEAA